MNPSVAPLLDLVQRDRASITATQEPRDRPSHVARPEGEMPGDECRRDTGCGPEPVGPHELLRKDGIPRDRPGRGKSGHNGTGEERGIIAARRDDPPIDGARRKSLRERESGIAVPRSHGDIKGSQLILPAERAIRQISAYDLDDVEQPRQPHAAQALRQLPREDGQQERVRGHRDTTIRDVEWTDMLAKVVKPGIRARELTRIRHMDVELPGISRIDTVDTPMSSVHVSRTPVSLVRSARGPRLRRNKVSRDERGLDIADAIGRHEHVDIGKRARGGIVPVHMRNMKPLEYHGDDVARDECIECRE